MSIKLKIKTKKHCITWDLNKFMQNIVFPSIVVMGFAAFVLGALTKANIFQVY